jgi:hypothetical protein
MLKGDPLAETVQEWWCLAFFRSILSFSFNIFMNEMFRTPPLDISDQARGSFLVKTHLPLYPLR